MDDITIRRIVLAAIGFAIGWMLGNLIREWRLRRLLLPCLQCGTRPTVREHSYGGFLVECRTCQRRTASWATKNQAALWWNKLNPLAALLLFLLLALPTVAQAAPPAQTPTVMRVPSNWYIIAQCRQPGRVVVGTMVGSEREPYLPIGCRRLLPGESRPSGFPPSYWERPDFFHLRTPSLTLFGCEPGLTPVVAVQFRAGDPAMIECHKLAPKRIAAREAQGSALITISGEIGVACHHPTNVLRATRSRSTVNMVCAGTQAPPAIDLPSGVHLLKAARPTSYACTVGRPSLSWPSPGVLAVVSCGGKPPGKAAPARTPIAASIPPEGATWRCSSPQLALIVTRIDLRRLYARCERRPHIPPVPFGDSAQGAAILPAGGAFLWCRSLASSPPPAPPLPPQRLTYHWPEGEAAVVGVACIQGPQ